MNSPCHHSHRRSSVECWRRHPNRRRFRIPASVADANRDGIRPRRPATDAGNPAGEPRLYRSRLLTPGAHLGTASNLAQGGQRILDARWRQLLRKWLRGRGQQLYGRRHLRSHLWLNTLVVVPVVDSIQEYRVMTSNYSAEYGNAAGTVTEVATKAGSNGFHGDAWEFVRNTDFNANNFFNNLNNIPRPAFHRNQFGLTAGRPIRKNRTFSSAITKEPGQPSRSLRPRRFPRWRKIR